MTVRVLGVGALRDRRERHEFTQTLSATGASESVKLTGPLVVSLTGTATNIVATVQRSADDSAWAPAESDPFSGDLTAGIPPRPYNEPVVGYWRVNVTTLTGGNVAVSITGENIG